MLEDYFWQNTYGWTGKSIIVNLHYNPLYTVTKKIYHMGLTSAWAESTGLWWSTFTDTIRSSIGWYRAGTSTTSCCCSLTAWNWTWIPIRPFTPATINYYMKNNVKLKLKLYLHKKWLLKDKKSYHIKQTCKHFPKPHEID